MFQKGDLIVYGNMGVCRVEAVEAPAGLPGAGEKKLYYKLDPAAHSDACPGRGAHRPDSGD